MYGRDDCDDTEAIREYFKTSHIDFREVNINEDREAEQFVIFINDGFRSTPTLILGTGKHKTILTEPSTNEIESILKIHHE
jgi:mycoredoxin